MSARVDPAAAETWDIPWRRGAPPPLGISARAAAASLPHGISTSTSAAAPRPAPTEYPRPPPRLGRGGSVETGARLRYGALVLFNFSLRFAWALAVFGHVSTRGLGMLNFELAELARRTVWALFRIEWEYHERKWPLDGDEVAEESLELVAHEDGGLDGGVEETKKGP